MATLIERVGKRSTTWKVQWRESGRGASLQSESFTVRKRAMTFKDEVERAGNRWPEGWVRGYGYGKGSEEEATSTEMTVFGAKYVDQLVELTPGQRKRYHSQVRVLAGFFPVVEDVTEADVKTWLIGWSRSIKTKANYHGLLWGIFQHAMRSRLVSVNPAADTAPSRKAIRAVAPEHVYLTECDYATFIAGVTTDCQDLVAVAISTGLRFGEITALWVDDIDLEHRQLHVRKAWKEDGTDGATETQPWLAKLLRSKHVMRGHHLGKPKTPKSRRTVEFGDEVAAILKRLIEGREHDDFVFVTSARSPGSAALRWAGGKPWHQVDFYENRWLPALGAAAATGMRKRPRFHDLRHTYVAWSLAAGADLPYIQQQLGHESITTTIDTYGHLMPNSNRHVTFAIDGALRGGKIIRYEGLKAV